MKSNLNAEGPCNFSLIWGLELWTAHRCLNNYSEANGSGRRSSLHAWTDVDLAGLWGSLIQSVVASRCSTARAEIENHTHHQNAIVCDDSMPFLCGQDTAELILRQNRNKYISCRFERLPCPKEEKNKRLSVIISATGVILSQSARHSWC